MGVRLHLEAMAFLGFVFAAASAVFNGSWAALSKSYPADQMVFTLQFCVGILLTSFVSLLDSRLICEYVALVAECWWEYPRQMWDLSVHCA